jgi:hypothetical protein
MRYRLRTLLIWATIGPPLLAVAWWILPHALPWVAINYFGAATLYFAAWWVTVRREAEEATQLKLKSATSPSRQLDQISN